MNTAKYDRQFVEPREHVKPPLLSPLRLPCPTSCGNGGHLGWTCDKCGSRLEYCRSDQYIYCQCGRCPFGDWSYRCGEDEHGPGFIHFDDNKFAELATRSNLNTEPLDELNILILGRTGVGKSTWINAFVNYLLHPSLDEGLEAGKLSWVIPFAFRTYSVNKDGEFEDLKVSVGFDQRASSSSSPNQKIGVQEQDGTAGGSATQRTVVHKVQVGSRLVRLIDTPGIGDTRGAVKDRENLSDIVGTLRTYKRIHGILILLKPNEQRLDLMFKFCVQELLTHLHRNAAQNIAFGFTNTRGTNYLPGDTFDPLRQLLQRFNDIKITLRKDSVYCFDSESFRYLAAIKTVGESMGQLEENRASWDYSVSEARRLLDHFAGLPPHNVTSTVNLYETRFRIAGMTRPMAEIADAIRSTILVNQDDINELSDISARGQGLLKLLKVKVKTVTAKHVDEPRTTCSHQDCIEHSTTGVGGIDGKEVLKTVYKSGCHSPCYLGNVKLDSIGDDHLRKCWAMQGDISEHCRVCSHHWMDHLHVNYLLEEGLKEVEDPDIKALVTSNASTAQKKEAGIAAKKSLIEELEAELNIIRSATAQFGIFLKRNAIMPYNDATLDYLDRCIEEEAGKVQAGGSAEKLENLKKYRKEYEQEILHLEEYMEKGAEELLLDQEGVDIMMKDLYSLKHYGAMLSDLSNFTHSLPAGANRERAHILRARDHWENPQKHRRSNKTSTQARVDSPPGPAPHTAHTPAERQPSFLKRMVSGLFRY